MDFASEKDRLVHDLTEKMYTGVDRLYGVVDSVMETVDGVLDGALDAAKQAERATRPQHKSVDASYTKSFSEMIDDMFGKHKQAEPAATEGSAPEPGGSDNTTPSLEETLSVVYDYLKGNNMLEESIEGMGKSSVLSGYTSTLSDQFRDAVYINIVGRHNYSREKFPLEWKRVIKNRLTSAN